MRLLGLLLLLLSPPISGKGRPITAHIGVKELRGGASAQVATTDQSNDVSKCSTEVS